MSRSSAIFIGLTLLAVMGTWMTAPGAAAATTDPWCRPTNDLTAQRFLYHMLELATSDDSGATRARAALDDVPKSDSSEVWLVSDDSLCYRASAALDSSFYTTPRGYPLYLARVGARYVAFPPSDSTMRFGIWVHLDSSFDVLKWSRF